MANSIRWIKISSVFPSAIFSNFNPLPPPGVQKTRSHQNFEAMRILRQRPWTEKVPLPKKPRRKINKRYFKAVSCFTRSKKIFFREFSLEGKETTELYKLLGIFEHTFEEYKVNFSFIKL